MALKIRLSRGGAKKKPFYRIVVAESLSPRDGKFIERLGSYDPMVESDRITLNVERIKYWISKGAKPTLRVAKLLSKDGIVSAPVIREQPIKSAPGKKRLEREAEEAKTEAAPAEEAKTEAAPAEEAKTEAAPAEEAKTEAAPAEEAKTEPAPAEEAKKENTPKESET
jgi:small subunit ribosomal protein S16